MGDARPLIRPEVNSQIRIAQEPEFPTAEFSEGVIAKQPLQFRFVLQDADTYKKA